mgnify:CR=1 FL=1
MNQTPWGQQATPENVAAIRAEQGGATSDEQAVSLLELARRRPGVRRVDVGDDAIDVAPGRLQLRDTPALVNQLPDHLAEAILLQVGGEDGDLIREAALAGQHLAVGDPAAVVDRHVQVLPAGPR